MAKEILFKTEVRGDAPMEVFSPAELEDGIYVISGIVEWSVEVNDNNRNFFTFDVFVETLTLDIIEVVGGRERRYERDFKSGISVIINEDPRADFGDATGGVSPELVRINEKGEPEVIFVVACYEGSYYTR